MAEDVVPRRLKRLEQERCVLNRWLSFRVVKLLVDLVKPVVTEEALPGVFALGAKPVAQVS